MSDDESDEEEDTNETTIEAIKIPVNADLTDYSSGVENYLSITEVTRQLIQDRRKALLRNQPTSAPQAAQMRRASGAQLGQEDKERPNRKI